MKRPVTVALGWDPPATLLNVGPALAILLIGAIVIKVHEGGLGLTADGRWLALALAVAVVAVLLRHRAPLLTLTVVLAVTAAVNYLPLMTLPVLVGLFTVAEYRDRRWVLGATIVAAAVMTLTPPAHGSHVQLPTTVLHVILVVLTVTVGQYVRVRAQYVGGLQERAERLERERELLAREAVSEERVRIARELHDVVAHNVSLMVVQAQALAATANGDAELNASLGRVASLGRGALSEMHRMLAVLRLDEDSLAGREPQPGVRELEQLIAATTATGLEVTLAVNGDQRELPPGVDLSAFRIVQEALTNVIRHADAAHAEVVLGYSPQELLVTVTDDGHGPSHANGDGRPGHGLVGMRERVALFGGALNAGPRPDARGFRVTATLPTG